MGRTIDHDDIDRAIAWRADHLAHVTKLVAKCNVAAPPSESDVIHPEWWKVIHWRWLDTVVATGGSNVWC